MYSIYNADDAVKEYNLIIEEFEEASKKLTKVRLRRWAYKCKDATIADLDVIETKDFIFGDFEGEYTNEDYMADGEVINSLIESKSSLLHQIAGAMRLLDVMELSYNRYNLEAAK